MKDSNYDKYPFVQVEQINSSCVAGWNDIAKGLNQKLALLDIPLKMLVIECYPGIVDTEVRTQLQEKLNHDLWIDAGNAFKDPETINQMIYPDVTDDRVFGFFTRRTMADYFDSVKMTAMLTQTKSLARGVIVVYGTGASYLFPSAEILVYADLARWEIQQRMRRNEISNLGVSNKHEDFAEKYKRGYFVDWRVADRLKKDSFPNSDYLLDTNKTGDPKLVNTQSIRKGLQLCVSRPFRLTPFFDPGPWGGQWMKEVCDLDRTVINYAWCFDCVPEENSLVFAFGDMKVEMPAINLVYFQSEKLLGQAVYARFGAEFPIRFDFLDTMGGGNLSLQVHPLTGYIQDNFGMHYTQDESYYIMDASDTANIYLGMKEKNTKEVFFEGLEQLQKGIRGFDIENFVAKWPANKHDHFSIPAGTIHCSGANCMVLEISATPYIFTFKLWDWDRPGLDGKPRPVHLQHGKKALQPDRDAEWVKANALDLVKPIANGDGWREEVTGLCELEFIETRRHWFTKKVNHDTMDRVNVLNLVEGREIVVESPHGNFNPFIVHYAETFIVPAAVGPYTISPHGEAGGAVCATIKAYVRD